MPSLSTSTLVPRVAFEALFTVAEDSPLEAAVVVASVAAALELVVLELLPQAASASDAANASHHLFAWNALPIGITQGKKRCPRRWLQSRGSPHFQRCGRWPHPTRSAE